MKFIHAADLHLSVSEKEYSLSVCAEIFAAAEQSGAALVLFAGDTFDSFSDADILRTEFKAIADRFGGQVFLLSGNHEELGKKATPLSRLDFGARVRVFDELPFLYTELDGIEFVLIPHQSDYSAYREWTVPPKKSKLRIAAAHGTVAGMSFTGISEDGGGIIDPDVFAFLQADYAAMGHIHSARDAAVQGVRIRYAGSARVWRRGETGEHCVWVVDTDSAQSAPVVMKSAGCYIEYEAVLALDGTLSDLSDLGERIGAHDFVDVLISGFVEDENIIMNTERELREMLNGRARCVDVRRGNVRVAAGISSEPIVKKFLDLMSNRKPENVQDEEHAVWLKAREAGLAKIVDAMEARR